MAISLGAWRGYIYSARRLPPTRNEQGVSDSPGSRARCLVGPRNETVDEKSRSGEGHRSGSVSSDDGDGPSGEELGSRASGATERASIVSNDTSGIKVELFERGTPVTLSISRDVTARAAVSGLPLKVGAIIRVPVFENTEEVDNFFRLFEREIPITLSISRDVTARATVSGVTLKVGDIIRVPIFENAEKVDSIFRDK